MMNIGSHQDGPKPPSQEKSDRDSKMDREGKSEKTEREKRQVGSGSISATSSPQDENNINFKNQLNDKLNKLQNSLAGFITEGEFNRFKAETRSKLEEGERRHEKLVNEY